MKYVGTYTQQYNNNIKSIILLLMFPTIILGTLWVALALINYFGGGEYINYWYEITNEQFVSLAPMVVAGVAIWFGIAYLFNTAMISRATGSRPLERRENPRVYNIVENLCMTCNMKMPKINVIDDPMLNAFASGINESSYTVTVTTGILNILDDEELAGVIGHELTHIRNRDTRLLITSIIFVGIISTVTTILYRRLHFQMIFGGGDSRRGKDNGLSAMAITLIVLACSAVAYLFVLLTRFAISRKREYMADAGGAELCGNPRALASALRKISNNPGMGNIDREDITQLCIIKPKLAASAVNIFSSLFSTHPDPAKRIAYLEQF